MLEIELAACGPPVVQVDLRFVTTLVWREVLMALGVCFESPQHCGTQVPILGRASPVNSRAILLDIQTNGLSFLVCPQYDAAKVGQTHITEGSEFELLDLTST